MQSQINGLASQLNQLSKQVNDLSSNMNTVTKQFNDLLRELSTVKTLSYLSIVALLLALTSMIIILFEGRIKPFRFRR
ncbi:MAG: hypothetical protein QXX09_03620 [Candidatus Methanomethylicia archaeon]